MFSDKLLFVGALLLDKGFLIYILFHLVYTIYVLLFLICVLFVAFGRVALFVICLVYNIAVCVSSNGEECGISFRFRCLVLGCLIRDF